MADERPDFCRKEHPDYDPDRCREWYYSEMASRTPEGRPSWPYDIDQGSARTFEGLPERFTWADVLRVTRYANVTEEENRAHLADWQRREMVTKAGEAYVKTGHRPYRTDLGVLSKGSGYGSNLDNG